MVDGFKKHGLLARSVGFIEEHDDRHWEHAALARPVSKHFRGPKVHDEKFHARARLYQHPADEHDIKVIERSMKKSEAFKNFCALNYTRWMDDAPVRRKIAEERLDKELNKLQREAAFKRLFEGPLSRAPTLTAMKRITSRTPLPGPTRKVKIRGKRTGEQFEKYARATTVDTAKEDYAQAAAWFDDRRRMVDTPPGKAQYRDTDLGLTESAERNL